MQPVFAVLGEENNVYILQIIEQNSRYEFAWQKNVRKQSEEKGDRKVCIKKKKKKRRQIKNAQNE